MIPHGYIASREMIDRIGRKLFAGDWIGDIEHRARSGLLSPEQIEYDKKAPGISAGGNYNMPDGWTGDWVGWTFKPSPKDQGTTEHEQERIARKRYDAACFEFLKRLEIGEIKASALDRETGRIRPISPDVWRTDRAAYYIAKGLGPAGEFYRNRVRHVREGALLIEETLTLVSIPVREVLPEERSRGNPDQKNEQVLDKMRGYHDIEQLLLMKQVALVGLFGTSRGTCKKARDKLREELLAKPKTKKKRL